MKYTLIFTVILMLYILSFSAVSKTLLFSSLLLSGLAMLYFPLFLLSMKFLSKKSLNKNLFMPLNIALVISTITNLASFNSPTFFAVMFLVQFIMIPFAVLWSAYEFHKEGLILPFVFSFMVWGAIVFIVGKFL